jgi:hypothetical protein
MIENGSFFDFIRKIHPPKVNPSHSALLFLVTIEEKLITMAFVLLLLLYCSHIDDDLSKMRPAFLVTKCFCNVAQGEVTIDNWPYAQSIDCINQL